MRRSANVDSWISEHDPSLRQIAEALRNLILSIGPNLRESVKWANPMYQGNDRVFYLSATERYVSLGFFDGASLDDPNGRIAGTGKRMRHVKVRALEDIDSDQFESWIKEALDIDARRST